MANVLKTSPFPLARFCQNSTMGSHCSSHENPKNDTIIKNCAWFLCPYVRLHERWLSQVTRGVQQLACLLNLTSLKRYQVYALAHSYGSHLSMLAPQTLECCRSPDARKEKEPNELSVEYLEASPTS